MADDRTWLRWAPVVLAAAACLTVVLPWARAGTDLTADEVLGIEIPVIGWSTLVATAGSTALLVIATIRRSAWWWVTANGVNGVVATCTAVTLVTLDVVDSSVAEAVVRALPEDWETASPSIGPAFGLWVLLALTVAIAGVTTLSTLRSSGSGGHRPDMGPPDPTGAVPASEEPGVEAIPTVESIQWH